MRDLNMMDVKAVSGAGEDDVEDEVKLPKQQSLTGEIGDGSVTVSCCSIGIGPIGVDYNGFSVTATTGPSVDPFDAKLGINTGL